MRALIAMSGGVDSSVAALLTMQQGFNCIGATMYLHDSGCAADAAAVADKLGIPFYEFDCRAEFCQRIKDHFVRSYEEGLTPNPCIECNRYMKFGRLLEIAESLDCECIVTGHYAQIDQDPSSGRYRLLKAADPGKDQSYFLCRLTQYQLAHTLFPLGQLTKAAARQIAEENGFINAKKQDSQDICFVPDGNYMEFLQQYTGKQYAPGAFLDNRGNVVGQHLGAVAYTIGQRKGLGLAMGEPVYVCDKDMKANTVTVGSNDTLFRRELQAHDWNWISIPSLAEPIRCKAKTRSRMIEQPATAYPMADGSVRVEFDELQRAITPGQAVVLYDGNSVVGAGTISPHD